MLPGEDATYKDIMEIRNNLRGLGPMSRTRGEIDREVLRKAEEALDEAEAFVKKMGSHESDRKVLESMNNGLEKQLDNILAMGRIGQSVKEWISKQKRIGAKRVDITIGSFGTLSREDLEDIGKVNAASMRSIWHLEGLGNTTAIEALTQFGIASQSRLAPHERHMAFFSNLINHKLRPLVPDLKDSSQYELCEDLVGLLNAFAHIIAGIESEYMVDIYEAIYEDKELEMAKRMAASPLFDAGIELSDEQYESMSEKFKQLDLGLWFSNRVLNDPDREGKFAIMQLFGNPEFREFITDGEKKEDFRLLRAMKAYFEERREHEPKLEVAGILASILTDYHENITKGVYNRPRVIFKSTPNEMIEILEMAVSCCEQEKDELLLEYLAKRGLF